MLAKCFSKNQPKDEEVENVANIFQFNFTLGPKDPLNQEGESAKKKRKKKKKKKKPAELAEQKLEGNGGEILAENEKHCDSSEQFKAETSLAGGVSATFAANREHTIQPSIPPKARRKRSKKKKKQSSGSSATAEASSADPASTAANFGNTNYLKLKKSPIQLSETQKMLMKYGKKNRQKKAEEEKAQKPFSFGFDL